MGSVKNRIFAHFGCRYGIFAGLYYSKCVGQVTTPPFVFVWCNCKLKQGMNRSYRWINHSTDQKTSFLPFRKLRVTWRYRSQKFTDCFPGRKFLISRLAGMSGSARQISKHGWKNKLYSSTWLWCQNTTNPAFNKAFPKVSIVLDWVHERSIPWSWWKNTSERDLRITQSHELAYKSKYFFHPK
jgi:hypothetical protein